MHPYLGEFYRKRVADLQGALADPRLQTEALEIVRPLVERSEVISGTEAAEIELVGDIAAMVERKKGRPS